MGRSASRRLDRGPPSRHRCRATSSSKTSELKHHHRRDRQADRRVEGVQPHVRPAPGVQEQASQRLTRGLQPRSSVPQPSAPPLWLGRRARVSPDGVVALRVSWQVRLRGAGVQGGGAYWRVSAWLPPLRKVAAGDRPIPALLKNAPPPPPRSGHRRPRGRGFQLPNRPALSRRVVGGRPFTLCRSIARVDDAASHRRTDSGCDSPQRPRRRLPS